MTGKYDALIAEAYQQVQVNLAAERKYTAESFRRMSEALREAQAHVPPEGWRVTEWTRRDGVSIRMHYQNEWRRSGRATVYPTAAAAMAAIEEMGK